MKERTEIKLSQIVDQIENKWHDEATEHLNPLMSFLCDNLRDDLYEKYKMRDSLELYQYLKFWLVATNQELLYDGLEKFGFDLIQFEREMVASVILSLTWERENADMVLDVMARNRIVRNLQKKDSGFILETSAGEFRFWKADEYFGGRNEIVDKLLQKKDLKGGCHEVSEELLKSDVRYRALMMICRKNLVENYWHSAVLLSDDKVVDLTGNLVIGGQEFCELYDTQEKMTLDYENYQELKAKTERYDESGTLWPLLRIAAYERTMNGTL